MTVIMIRLLLILRFRKRISLTLLMQSCIKDREESSWHSKKLGLPLRQSYTFVLKKIYRDQRFRNHPRNRKKALRADRCLRTIAGRLVRELKRNLKENHDYDELLRLFETVLSQRRNSRKKIYSIHEPDVQCISKGKEHKKYEFGNKVSIIRSVTGIILGAMSFRNEYDGHTIEASLEQVERLTGRKVKVLAGDRGYRGRKDINGTKIIIPDVPRKSDSRYQRLKNMNFSASVQV